MKKILFLCESLEIGGAERALHTLLRHLNLNKFNITVCSLCDVGYYSTLIKQIPGINYNPILIPQNKSIKRIIYKIKYNLIYKFLNTFFIYKIFVPKGNDVEIAFCEGFATKILSKSTNKKSKKIAWVHTDLRLNNWPVNIGIYKDINEENNVYNKFHNIVGVSKSVTNNLIKLLHQKDNITTLYNLIDETEIKGLSYQDINISFETSKLKIVSVGRLSKVKGYDRLINICAKLIIEDHLNINLIIVGGGVEYNNLSKQIAELGISQSVKLIGPQNNPYPYIKMADLYVCPSRQEGYNIALAEAIILEKPCISTNCSGPDEILENGKYGYLVDNNDDSLYLGLKDLICNTQKLDYYKSLSIKRKSFFELKKNAAKIESLIEL